MRLPVIKPDEMTARQQEIAARIAGRRGAVRGPFQVWLNSPELCERVEALGAFLRWESSLPLRLRELSLLLAARHFDAQYSWNAHVAKCVEEGIPQAAIDAIARNEVPRFDNLEDDAFYRFCHELLEEHFVTDETFAGALKFFGPQGLVDTVGSLGNFSMLGMCLNAFQVDLQAGKEPPFPDVKGYARIVDNQVNDVTSERA
ncbi:carboxymuconolactone decarboxylase family protein [Paractinoplanes globisporus]|uniref:Carboxymuconolactone decarboxylase family protein n=1 Tax=Paractinoplanes globisporus TaxID=113565 RepID=A0ABW6WWQ9_9ACTN|nr:carboxymuconolactone decarboxylase family protein [Actinoplanes globisporus]